MEKVQNKLFELKEKVGMRYGRERGTEETTQKRTEVGGRFNNFKIINIQPLSVFKQVKSIIIM